MNIGQLAWRTPTGAMLWEIWARHKWGFLGQGAGLAASVLFAYWRKAGVFQDAQEGLGLASFLSFFAAYGHLLICLSNFEVDAGRVQMGFPGRLLLKPVSTAGLVLVPMVLGGAVSVTFFVIWAELMAWQHLMAFTPADLLWASAALLSLSWWLQVVSWSLPWLQGRMWLVFMVAVLHFLVWHPPPVFAGGWQKPVLAVLLVGAAPAAWLGLKRVRLGAWEGPSRMAMLGIRLRRTRGGRKPFGSGFRAQFWLEWRRQGLLLPMISGGVACGFLAVALLFWLLFRKISGTAGPGGDPETAAFLMTYFIQPMLILPLILSVIMAPLITWFDRFHPKGELPVFIAIRPISNGGLILAKLAMALATSALTWLVTAVACLCLMLMEKDALFSQAGLITPFGPVGFLTGCVPVLLLLVLWTWKNLVAGLGAGLCQVWKSYGVNFGLFLLVTTAQTNANFRAGLLHWLTPILIAVLVVKLAVAVTVLVSGVRRNAVTVRMAGCLMGGWLACGLFVAGYAGHVCQTIHRPDWWIWGALGGFLVLPLADLAIAPLALAWSRHR